MAYTGLIGKSDGLNHTIKSGSVIGKSDGLNHKIAQILQGMSDGLNHVLWKAAVSYTSTYAFPYSGSAINDIDFAFNVSGSTPGFHATITFAEAIEITSLSFSLSRQNADIDVTFSGFMRLLDEVGNIITVISASEHYGTVCESGGSNPSPGTKIKSVYLSASGADSRVTQLYMAPSITVAGASKQLYRSGEIEV